MGKGVGNLVNNYPFARMVEKRVRLSCRWFFVAFTILASLSPVFIRFNEYGSQSTYCLYLENNLLDVYHVRHHQWPANLEDVERDLENDVYRNDSNVMFNRANMMAMYRNYRPHMTILYKGNDSLQVRVVFTKGNFCRGVFTVTGFTGDPPPVVVEAPLR